MKVKIIRKLSNPDRDGHVVVLDNTQAVVQRPDVADVVVGEHDDGNCERVSATLRSIEAARLMLGDTQTNIDTIGSLGWHDEPLGRATHYRIIGGDLGMMLSAIVEEMASDRQVDLALCDLWRCEGNDLATEGSGLTLVSTSIERQPSGVVGVADLNVFGFNVGRVLVPLVAIGNAAVVDSRRTATLTLNDGDVIAVHDFAKLTTPWDSIEAAAAGLDCWPAERKLGAAVIVRVGDKVRVLAVAESHAEALGRWRKSPARRFAVVETIDIGREDCVVGKGLTLTLSEANERGHRYATTTSSSVLLRA